MAVERDESESGLAAGLIVDHFGYNAAFLVAAAVASGAFFVLVIAMPETADMSWVRVRREA